MVQRPPQMCAFEFAVVAGLRTSQLVRGCTPRVTSTPLTKVAVTAQMEVAAGKVARDAAVVK